MKRTNVVLDEQLLEEAVRLSGERTYSKAINRALEEMVRRIKIKRLFDLQGKVVFWDNYENDFRGGDRSARNAWTPKTEEPPRHSVIREGGPPPAPRETPPEKPLPPRDRPGRGRRGPR